MHWQIIFVLSCTYCLIIFGLETGCVSSHEFVAPRKKSMEKEEKLEFVDFKTDVIREMQQLKKEIRQLKAENEVKDSKIKALEQKVSDLQKGQGRSQVRGRRDIYGDNIAFTAYLDHDVHNLTQDQPIIYNKVLLNDGNGYNAKTGMFTAPVSGVYLFSYSVGAKVIPGVQLSQYDVFTRLIVDGVHQLSAVAESTNTYDDEQGSSTAIVYVQEAATVWTKHEFKGGNNLYSASFERITSFAGTLLYEKESLDNSGIIG